MLKIRVVINRDASILVCFFVSMFCIYISEDLVVDSCTK